MEPLYWVLIVVGALGLGAVVYVAVLYNGFIRHRNMVAEAWSGIDVQLKRRHDLIPNLVEIVKGYAKHEHEVFGEIAKARSTLGGLQRDDRAAREAGENAFTAQLKHLLVMVEAYPDLKADKNFLQLQHDLVEVEETLQYARRYYNGSVRDYNIAIASFPANLLAGTTGFQPAIFFEIETATERQAPAVQMSA